MPVRLLSPCRQLSWEIDLFGRLTNAKRGAKAALLQSREYEQAVQTQLVASVANAYYTLLMLDAQYEIATATEKVLVAFAPSKLLIEPSGAKNRDGR